jgi:hypothetical protein
VVDVAGEGEGDVGGDGGHEVSLETSDGKRPYVSRACALRAHFSSTGGLVPTGRERV